MAFPKLLALAAVSLACLTAPVAARGQDPNDPSGGGESSDAESNAIVVIVALNWGSQFLFMGQLDQAEAYFGVALAAAEEEAGELGLNHQAAALSGLGGVAAARSDFEGARDHYARALDVVERLGHLGGQGTAHGALLTIAVELGDRASAEEHLALAVQFFDAQMVESSAAGDHRGAYAVASALIETTREARTAGLASDLDHAQALGQGAWYGLFAGAFDEAEASAREGLELDPSQTWIATNLAHALMFLDRLAEADAVYDRHRGVVILGDQVWEAAIASDFALLRDAGFDHPHMDVVLARLGE